MEKIKAMVVRSSRYGVISAEEEVYVLPGLDRALIRANLVDQASEFSDSEILNDITVGGIYFDPESQQWLVVRIGTNNIAEEIGDNASTEAINNFLLNCFTDVGHDFGLENDPVDVRLLEDKK